MISKTLTNEISVTINYSNLLAKYNIYKIKNDSNSTKEYQEFYKTVRVELKPLASTRDRGHTLIAYPIKKEMKLDSKYEIKKMMFAELKREKDYILMNLINSLLANESNYFGIESDPYGLYYLVKSTKSKLISIKIYIDKNMHLSLNVATFKKSINKKDKEIYILKENKIVRALNRNKDEIYYIKGSYTGSKSTYPFLGLQLNYKDSKVYVLSKYIESINHYFGNILFINFTESYWTLYDDGNGKNERNQELKNRIVSFLKSKKKIHIANYSNTNLKHEIEKLKNVICLYTGLDILVTNSLKINNEGLNLTITRDKDYYSKNKLEDPYKHIKDSSQITQNFTTETLQEILSSKNKNMLIHVLLKECVIKEEIKDKKISLPYKQILDGFIFVYPEKEKDKYLFYKIKFLKEEMIFGNITQSEKRVCDEILMTQSNFNMIETIIFDDDGNIGYLQKTNNFTLPKFEQINHLINEYEKPLYLNNNEIIHIWDSIYHGNEESKKEELKKQLTKLANIHSGKINILKINIGKVQKFKNALSKKAGKNITFNIRRAENRHLIDSLIGIRYIKHDEYARYIVGSDKNLDKTITKASTIRELHYYRGKILIEDILSMMSEYFVKNGSFTVLPYPLKYIREYFEIGSK